MMAKTTLAHFFSKPFLIVSNMIFMTFLRQKVLKKLAEWTGLEPATPGVTGRYSNQLNYHSLFWWVLTGSNRRHSPCKGDALPAELSTQNNIEDAILQ